MFNGETSQIHADSSNCLLRKESKLSCKLFVCKHFPLNAVVCGETSRTPAGFSIGLLRKESKLSCKLFVCKHPTDLQLS